MLETPLSTFALILLLQLGVTAQQRADEAFTLPDTGPSKHAAGEGPLVGIDEAHHNFHTLAGRYRTFGALLSRDGYVVKPSTEPFTLAALKPLEVLVISNALSAENVTQWSLPNHSAFTDEEIQSVATWVREGGRLLLIADHMPMPGAAAKLAATFGVLFYDGYVFGPDGSSQLTFSRTDESLVDHLVIRREGGGEIPHVTTFGGQGFRFAPGVKGEPLLRLPAASLMMLPFRHGQYDEKTPRIPAEGLLQGGLLRFGKGRIAVFGEAAQFSAQITARGSATMGMNSPKAKHNARFLLNVMSWLVE